MTNGKPHEFEPEFEEEPFHEEGFEHIDKVIPFDAEEEESVLLMGPESESLSQELDIADVVDEAESPESGEVFSTLHNEKERGSHIHTGTQKRHVLNFGRFFMGIVLVFVGLVFLGQNMGWFDIVRIDLLSLWPIILIFLGLSMFSASRWWSKIFGFFAVLIVALLVLAALMGGSGIVDVNLTGNIVEEEREAVDFSRISLEGVGSMVIVQGNKESLIVQADSALLPKIETDVSQGTLRLRFTNPFFQFLFFNNVDINYFITVKDIESVNISGAGNVTSLGIETESLEISINGTGNANLDIDVEEFVARISGSGKYTVNGTADRQIIHISGSGKYFGKDVVSLETGVRISGSGEVEVNASEELDVTISGSGKVRYLGEPFISNSSISGSGSIENFDAEDPNVLMEDSSVLDKLKKIDETEEFDIDTPVGT